MFVNYENDEHSLIGFDDEADLPHPRTAFRAGWHCHGDFGAADPRGRYVALDYLTVVSGLADGTVLVCERWRGAQLRRRSLIHRDYSDEFDYLEIGDEVRVRRATLRGVRPEPT